MEQEIIHNQMVCIDAGCQNGMLQQSAEHIVADLSHKSAGFAQFAQHGQHIAGCAAGTSLKQAVALIADAVFREVNQKLAQSDNI